MKRHNGAGAIFAALLLILQTGYAQDPAGHGGLEFAASEDHPAVDPRSTYEKFLPPAEAGDPDMQNMLGFMYFYAEGVGLDYDMAHSWFHQAAEQGNPLAQRNLGLFHSRTWPRIPEEYFDPVEANFWFSLHAAGKPGGSQLAARSYHTFLNSIERNDEGRLQHNAESGQEIYLTFCAGCHGFEDSAPFPHAPSLLNGENLEKSEGDLLASILDGKGTMPAWRDTISDDQARSVLSYLRERHAEINGSGQAAPVTEDLAPEEQGEYLYTRFCGGCHGFNGISYYVSSPSFALRHRMEKNDSELAGSIAKGVGVMPGWENMLSTDQIAALVRFIRSLAPAYESGIDHDIRVAPELYFLFQPLGETDDDWHIRRDQ